MAPLSPAQEGAPCPCRAPGRTGEWGDTGPAQATSRVPRQAGCDQTTTEKNDQGDDDFTQRVTGFRVQTKPSAGKSKHWPCRQPPGACPAHWRSRSHRRGHPAQPVHHPPGARGPAVLSRPGTQSCSARSLPLPHLTPAAASLLHHPARSTQGPGLPRAALLPSHLGLVLWATTRGLPGPSKLP